MQNLGLQHSGEQGLGRAAHQGAPERPEGRRFLSASARQRPRGSASCRYHLWVPTGLPLPLFLQSYLFHRLPELNPLCSNPHMVSIFLTSRVRIQHRDQSPLSCCASLSAGTQVRVRGCSHLPRCTPSHPRCPSRFLACQPPATRALVHRTVCAPPARHSPWSLPAF